MNYNNYLIILVYLRMSQAKTLTENELKIVLAVIDKGRNVDMHACLSQKVYFCA